MSECCMDGYVLTTIMDKPCSKKSVVVRKSTGVERAVESLHTEFSFKFTSMMSLIKFSYKKHHVLMSQETENTMHFICYFPHNPRWIDLIDLRNT